jgi:STE24 endopeptidase
MIFTAYTIAFAAAFAAHRGLETALDIAQLLHLARRRDRVPKHLEGKVALETVRQAVAYNAEKLRFGVFSRFYDGAILWLLVAWGFAAFDRAAAALFAPGIFRGLAFFGLAGLALSLVHLPLEAYAAFSIEARHGFNRRTWVGFAADNLKELALLAIVGGGLLALVLWLMSAAGGWFWLVGFACVAAVQLLVAWLYPVAIMPLFNKFTPVAGDLAADVGALADRVGFPLGGVVAMDGSRRSSHVNAFIVGLVGSRRIVLYDTLVQKLSRAQLLAVLAHELGHFSLGHLRGRLLVALAGMLAAFAALGLAAPDPALATGMGFEGASGYAGLAAFFVLASEALFPLMWLGRVASRRQELAADGFGARATSGEALCEALVALTKQNLTSPGSAKAYRAYYNTHPSLRERLGAIEKVTPTGEVPG